MTAKPNRLKPGEKRISRQNVTRDLPSERLFDNWFTKYEADQLLSGEDLSKLLGVSSNALKIMRFKKTIPSVKVGKNVRYRWGDIVRWLHRE